METEDYENYEVTDDELYADAEIPESNWQLDAPLNLASVVDPDDDDSPAEEDNPFLADYAPQFIAEMTSLGYVCNPKTGEWE